MNDTSSTCKKHILTNREVDVLRLMDEGRSNKAIAEELGLSYNTVTWNVRQIFNKLGVNRRMQAIAMARSLGILNWVGEIGTQESSHTLTEREVDVLKLMDAGYSNQAIAEQFVLSYNTVAWYVRQIFKKLDVNRRTQAVAMARSLGILNGVTESLSQSRYHQNLPIQATPFIGRVNELAEIQVRLKESDCRLLTLLGPGGSGKTRLAIEVVGQLLDEYKHGAYFVNLAPLQSTDLIPTTIAGALRFSFSGEGTPEEQLLDYLRNKEMLLILDNFEHLLNGVGFVNQIMGAAPRVKILVTSRARLMVMGEYIYDLWGMDYPESHVSLKIVSHQYSAIKLFESGASRLQSNFKLSDNNLMDVIQVCSLLEGMPLGIVLAANWVTMLAPAEIAMEIKRDLAFLDTELRDLPRRQRGMRSVFNHSWRLLREGERQIMKVLSVFRGGFTRDAARKVAGACLPDLKGLADQSMLYRISSGRYEIHEMVRQYAVEKLAGDSAAEVDILEKHSNFYCQALAVWERDLQGPRQAAANQEMKAEIDNIRMACRWAVENLSLTSLIAGINGLCIFCQRNGQYLEAEVICRSLVERLDAISASEQPEVDLEEKYRTTQIDILKLQARALAWRGYLNSNIGNRDLAHELMKKCLYVIESDALAEQDTRFEKALAYSILPWVMEINRLETIQLAEEGLQLFKSLDEPWWVGVALSGLGHLANSVNEVDKQKLYREASLAVRRKLGDLRGIADSLIQLSWDTTGKKAEEMLYEALAISTELDDRFNIVFAYGALGLQWIWQGRFEKARSLHHETQEAYRNLDFSQSFAASFFSNLGYPDLQLGCYQVAQELAAYSIALFEESNNYFASFNAASSISILGSVALAEGCYTEAEIHFNECLLEFQKQEHPASISETLTGLGFAARGMSQNSLAQENFYQALRLAIDNHFFIPLVHALTGIALLFADQGEVERAVELYALASTYGIVANSRWFADIAGDEIAAAAESLPVDLVKAAQSRGRELDLWTTADQLLVSLEEMGWASEDL